MKILIQDELRVIICLEIEIKTFAVCNFFFGLGHAFTHGVLTGERLSGVITGFIPPFCLFILCKVRGLVVNTYSPLTIAAGPVTFSKGYGA